MSELSTATLHERADTAAGSGNFEDALRLSAEALRAVAQDHRARLKIGLCLYALGHKDDGVAVLGQVARTLRTGGFTLSAIGACRDALGFDPGSKNILEVLAEIHADIKDTESTGRARVPPPIPPETVSGEDPASFFAIEGRDELVKQAHALAMATPPVATEPSPTAVPLFSDLSEQVFVSLVSKMGYLKVPGGHHVVKQGDEGSSLFIVIHGDVSVRREGPEGPQELARLGAGALFGELSLMTSKPRSATVVTTQASELFEIDRKIVEEIAADHPSITEELVSFARRRLLMNLMATSPIFKPFDEQQRFAILRAFRSRIVKAGDVLIEEGSDGSGLFLVLEGEVEVSKKDESGDKLVLAYLRIGQVFGEISLIKETPTTATVAAAESSVVLYLDRADFSTFTEDHPEILSYLSELSTERVAETNEAMSEGVYLEADDLIVL